MLKFSKHAKAASAGRLSPESRDIKKQKLDDINDGKDSDFEETPECNAAFKQFDNLKKTHHEFEKFLAAVSGDLTVKSENLKALKNCLNTKLNDKSYAGVQLFMLSQYSHRINRFREVSRNSLDHIFKNIEKENNAQELIAKHIDILGKMKRRMKHIIDVSEKYAVENIFDSINLLREMSEAMEPSPPEKKVKMGKCKSMNSLHKIRHDTIESIGSDCDLKETSSEASNVLTKSRKVNTLRSLSEHLAVLTKTYTNRR